MVCQSLVVFYLALFSERRRLCRVLLFKYELTCLKPTANGCQSPKFSYLEVSLEKTRAIFKYLRFEVLAPEKKLKILKVVE